MIVQSGERVAGSVVQGAAELQTHKATSRQKFTKNLDGCSTRQINVESFTTPGQHHWLSSSGPICRHCVCVCERERVEKKVNQPSPSQMRVYSCQVRHVMDVFK